MALTTNPPATFLMPFCLLSTLAYSLLVALLHKVPCRRADVEWLLVYFTYPFLPLHAHPLQSFICTHVQHMRHLRRHTCSTCNTCNTCNTYNTCSTHKTYIQYIRCMQTIQRTQHIIYTRHIHNACKTDNIYNTNNLHACPTKPILQLLLVATTKP